MKRNFLLLLVLFIGLTPSLNAQSIYFPPILNQTIWETQTPESLGWSSENTDSLYQYLEEEHTKAFLLLKDGRIVLERYFGSFTQDCTWYWASAGKTLTSFLVAKAIQEQNLNQNDRTNQYLPVGWTSCTPEKENLITIRNQLTMTSGLDDGVPDHHCTLSSCLQYLVDAGIRWAYHNAPYTLLEKVIEGATGSDINVYTQSKLKTPTGMTGLWFTSGYNNVFASKARSMARFGLLVQNGFKWNSTPLLPDSLANQLTNTSQNFNISYGYLWWLNGKSSYKLPGSQLTFPGPLCPQAPMDMVAALGKNGQILCISKEKGLVLVRMGNAPTGPGSEVPNVFVNEIWRRINKVLCATTSTLESQNRSLNFKILHNPITDELILKGSNSGDKILIYNSFGNQIKVVETEQPDDKILVSTLPPGVYWLSVQDKSGRFGSLSFLKL